MWHGGASHVAPVPPPTQPNVPHTSYMTPLTHDETNYRLGPRLLGLSQKEQAYIRTATLGMGEICIATASCGTTPPQGRTFLCQTRDCATACIPRAPQPPGPTGMNQPRTRHGASGREKDWAEKGRRARTEGRRHGSSHGISRTETSGSRTNQSARAKCRRN